MSQRSARLAVDIGGTFTDIVVERADGSFVSGKFLTTHQAPEQAVLAGSKELMQRAGIAPTDISTVVHGTTLATNALIERKGARVALLTTEGFRDTLEIAHEHRFEVSDLYMKRGAPLVSRDLRFEAKERVAADGSVLIELQLSSLDPVIDALVKHKIESLAICFLHSYAFGEHEKLAAEYIARALPDISITVSHAICPEIREYERTSTTCANAYVRPVMETYLRRLEDGMALLGVTGKIMLMMSNGGLASIDLACEQPIKLVESGPAGGAVLAAHVAREQSFDKAVAFDMGGTTAKIVLIDNGTPQVSRHLEVARAYRFLKGSGMPLRIPVVDLVEIGAGGGSIAHIDALGRVMVGPESAGSEPGPACYGRGGENPTVTDSDLLLGKLDPIGFAGGKFDLQPDLSRAAIIEHLGEPDPVNSAAAIVEMVDENMANAARVHATDNGKQLEDRVMIAFGGAAPLHAARVAQKLGIKKIVIPRGAGVGSAHGFLLAPVSYEAVRTRLVRLGDFDVSMVNQMFEQMRDEAEKVVRIGTSGTARQETRKAYMRYRGQGHELAIDLPSPPFEDESAKMLRALFEAAYTQYFGRIIPGIEIECLTWTSTLSAPTGGIEPSGHTATGAPVAHTPARRPLFDMPTMSFEQATVRSRESLDRSEEVKGPAIIWEEETTTIVPSGFIAKLNANGHIILDSEEN